jgi:hypothetical protein
MTNKRITSIEIHMYSSVFSLPDEIQAEKVMIYRSGVIKHKLFNGLSEIAIQEFEYNINKLDAENFFLFLVSKIKVEEWKSDYSVEVCDGWNWNFKVRYSTNQVIIISGTVVAPPNAKQLEKRIKKLVKFEVNPWIF